MGLIENITAVCSMYRPEHPFNGVTALQRTVLSCSVKANTAEREREEEEIGGEVEKGEGKRRQTEQKLMGQSFQSVLGVVMGEGGLVALCPEIQQPHTKRTAQLVKADCRTRTDQTSFSGGMRKASSVRCGGEREGACKN
ncbi:hypothetical protein JZ751_006909 [Albula glossodonta]|uniref:Uncharacterized protein n=1 Tax=Albula glossodonta TaxID=121402 RepID=A0A8T2PAQ6_9TELE|nr:hypothetical protein JZ751_006909 [Albula glossodonta]